MVLQTTCAGPHFFTLFSKITKEKYMSNEENDMKLVWQHIS